MQIKLSHPTEGEVIFNPIPSNIKIGNLNVITIHLKSKCGVEYAKNIYLPKKEFIEFIDEQIEEIKKRETKNLSNKNRQLKIIKDLEAIKLNAE